MKSSEHFKKEIKKMSRKELVEYANFQNYNWWNVQGNWMQRITERYGTSVAEEFDTMIWGRNAQVQAWKLKEILDLENDMEGFVKGMILSTVFSNVDYEIPELNPKRCRFLITNCTMQNNRLKSGLPELPCKNPGVAACEAFATAYNNRIQVTCLQCPPDPHSENEWCHWLFEMKE